VARHSASKNTTFKVAVFDVVSRVAIARYSWAVAYQRYNRAANVKLGRNLAKLRQAVGLSQDRLAERLGISVRHMQRVESGKSAPSLPLLLDLHKALKVDWNGIFSGF